MGNSRKGILTELIDILFYLLLFVFGEFFSKKIYILKFKKLICFVLLRIWELISKRKPKHWKKWMRSLLWLRRE